MFEVNKNMHMPKMFIEGTKGEGLLKCSMYMCISNFDFNIRVELNIFFTFLVVGA